MCPEHLPKPLREYGCSLLTHMRKSSQLGLIHTLIASHTNTGKTALRDRVSGPPFLRRLCNVRTTLNRTAMRREPEGWEDYVTATAYPAVEPRKYGYGGGGPVRCNRHNNSELAVHKSILTC